LAFDKTDLFTKAKFHDSGIQSSFLETNGQFLISSFLENENLVSTNNVTGKKVLILLYSILLNHQFF